MIMNKIELGVISVVSGVVFAAAVVGSVVLYWSARSTPPSPAHYYA